MSLSEIASRIRDQAIVIRMRRQHQLPLAALPPEPPGSHRNPEFMVGDITLEMPGIASHFLSLLKGELHYGGGDWHFDDEASAWHREHTTLSLGSPILDTTRIDALLLSMRITRRLTRNPPGRHHNDPDVYASSDALKRRVQECFS